MTFPSYDDYRDLEDGAEVDQPEDAGRPPERAEQERHTADRLDGVGWVIAT